MGHPFVLAVCAAFTALALAWGLLLPIFESPDAQNHYQYMVFLKDHDRLPDPLATPPEVVGEGHQPPVYYLLGAAALKLFAPDARFQPLPGQPTDFDRQPIYFRHGVDEGLLRFSGEAWPPHLLRVLQVCFLLLPAVLLLGLLLEALLPPLAARLSFAVLALNPALLALAGGLNNDHAAFALGTLGFACLLPALRGRPLPQRSALAWGLATGLACLAKPTAIGLLLAGLVVMLRQPKGRRGLAMGAGLSPVALLLGAWMLRNWSLYGDPSGWRALVATCPQCLHAKPIFNGRWWQYWLGHSFESFWSIFGWMTWRAPLWATRVYALLGTLAWMGAVHRWRLGGALRLARWSSLAAFLGVLAVVLRHDLSLDPPSGRYFFAALAPIAVLFGDGLAAFTGRWRAWTAWALLLILSAYNVWLLLGRLLPFYYPGF